MVPHRATPFLLAFLILASPFFTSSGGFRGGQTQPTQPPPPAGADPPGTIDGAKNPELIPDEVAYRMVLIAVAEPENPTDAQIARFRAKIASAGLDDADTEAVRLVLATFQKQLDALGAQINQILTRNPLPYAGTPDYQQLVDLGQQRQPVFAEAMSALPARLSVAGLAKLDAFVQREKKRMKYLPEKP